MLVMHGDAAHSCYFGKDAYADMVKDSKYTENKELLIIPELPTRICTMAAISALDRGEKHDWY